MDEQHSQAVALLEEWLHDGRFLVGNTPEKDMLVERTRKLIEAEKCKTLLVDSRGREWHILEREGGSISVYYTLKDEAPNFIVWDSLDCSGPWLMEQRQGRPVPSKTEVTRIKVQ